MSEPIGQREEIRLPQPKNLDCGPHLRGTLSLIAVAERSVSISSTRNYPCLAISGRTVGNPRPEGEGVHRFVDRIREARGLRSALWRAPDSPRPQIAKKGGMCLPVKIKRVLSINLIP